MSAIIDIEMPPVPEPVAKPRTKWDDEFAAYKKLLPSLIADGHEGKYVAIHEGRVIGIGEDKVRLAMDSYRTYGYQEILVRLVSYVQPIVRIPGLRIAN